MQSWALARARAPSSRRRKSHPSCAPQPQEPGQVPWHQGQPGPDRSQPRSFLPRDPPGGPGSRKAQRAKLFAPGDLFTPISPPAPPLSDPLRYPETRGQDGKPGDKERTGTGHDSWWPRSQAADPGAGAPPRFPRHSLPRTLGRSLPRGPGRRPEAGRAGNAGTGWPCCEYRARGLLIMFLREPESHSATAPCPQTGCGAMNCLAPLNNSGTD